MRIIYRYNQSLPNIERLGGVLHSLELSDHPSYEWQANIEIRDAGYQRLIEETKPQADQISLWKTPDIG